MGSAHAIGQALEAVGACHPTFAGVYFDFKERPHLSATGPIDTVAVVALLDSLVYSGRLAGLAADRLSLHRVRYTYRELAGWARRVAPAFDPLVGRPYEGGSVDVAWNQVVVSFHEAVPLAKVEAVFESIPVPRGAFLVQRWTADGQRLVSGSVPTYYMKRSGLSQ